jgi:K+-sensing histidine kinase KdpD
MLIQSGEPVASLLINDQYTYEQFENGSLLLSLSHGGREFQARVTRMDQTDVFVIEGDDAQTELKTLSMAATTLRQPVSSVIATVGNLTHLLDCSDNPKASEYMAQMNRQLWRIHRMLCNMSDALIYDDDYPGRMICLNITGVIQEIFQKAEELAKHCNITLKYNVPSDTILCLIDEQLLERAVYNMISNALKASSKGGSVTASLTCRDKRIFLSVEGDDPTHTINCDIFQCYRRPPGIEDARTGLGLGMTLLRSAARVHGGTVLVDQQNGHGNRVTLSFPVRVDGDSILASGIVKVDYAGGWDHALLELSDVLPAYLYTTL